MIKYCEECGAVIAECDCGESEYEDFEKTKTRSKEKFDGPGKDEVWEKVPSPYKSYKEGI